jgi:hypothetical protein
MIDQITDPIVNICIHIRGDNSLQQSYEGTPKSLKTLLGRSAYDHRQWFGKFVHPTITALPPQMGCLVKPFACGPFNCMMFSTFQG